MDRPLTELIDATVKLLKLPATPEMTELFQQIIRSTLDQEVEDPNEFLIDLLEKSRPEAAKETIGQAMRSLMASPSENRPEVEIANNGIPQMIMVGGMRSNLATNICAIVVLVFYIFVTYKAYPHITFNMFTKGLIGVVIDYFQSMFTRRMALPRALMVPFNTINRYFEPTKHLYILDQPQGAQIILLYFDKISKTFFTKYIPQHDSSTIKFMEVQSYASWTGHLGRADNSLKNRYAAKGYTVDNLLVIPVVLWNDMMQYQRAQHYETITKERFDLMLETDYISYQPRPIDGEIRESINETMSNLMFAEETLQPFSAYVPNCIRKLATIKTTLLRLRSGEPVVDLRIQIRAYNNNADYVELVSNMADNVNLLNSLIFRVNELHNPQLNAFIVRLNALKNSLLRAANENSNPIFYVREDGRDIMLTRADTNILEALETGFINAAIVGPAANLALDQLIGIINRPPPRPFFYQPGTELHEYVYTMETRTPFTAFIRIDLTDEEEGVIANAVAILQQMAAAAAPIGRMNTTAAGRTALTAFHDSAPVAEPAVFANDAALTDPVSLDDIPAGQKYAFWIGDGGPPIIAFTWEQFQNAGDATALFHTADGTIVNLPYEPVTADGRIKVLLANTHYTPDQFRWTVRTGAGLIAQILRRKRRTQAEITAANAAAFLARAGPLAKRRASRGGRRGVSRGGQRKHQRRTRKK